MVTAGQAGRFGPSHVLALTAGLAPLVGFTAALGLAPLFVAASLGVLATGWRRRPWRAFPRAILLPMTAILAWMAVSALWAIDPAHALHTTGLMVVQTACGIVLVGAAMGLDEEERRRVGRGVVAGLLVGVAFLAVTFATHFAPTRLLHHLPPGTPDYSLSAAISRGTTVQVLLLWGGLLALMRSGAPRWQAALLALAVAVPTFLLHTLAAKIAIAAAVFLLAVTGRCGGRRVGAGLAVAFFAAVMLAPVAAHFIPPPQVAADEHLVPPVLHHRLTIWRFVGQRIAEKPLLGWGMESSRDMPGGEDRIVVTLTDGIHRANVDEQFLPLHPHNAALQWWVELGGVGALLFAVLLGRILLAAGSVPAAAISLATVVNGAVASLVSYGFWQSWWECSLWLAATLVVALGAAKSSADSEALLDQVAEGVADQDVHLLDAGGDGRRHHQERVG